jgi:hypothetical protein
MWNAEGGKIEDEKLGRWEAGKVRRWEAMELGRRKIKAKSMAQQSVREQK